MDHKAAPPSPAPSHHDELPSGFNQLVQHNNLDTTSFPRDPASMEAMQAAPVHSQPGSRYAWPMPSGLPDGLPYYDPAPQISHQQHQYGYPPPYSTEGSPYPPPEEYGTSYLTTHQSFNPNTLTPAASPPTPLQRSEILHNLRSGVVPRAATGRAVRSGRVEKTPPKKKQRVKAIKKVPKLEKPLSELTQGWSHIAIVDIDAYVNRSTEDRVREVEEGKIPGKIKRPMNAFMLYRKAYQNRTKHWCSQHNHQVVSQVCGDSWPLEPESIRQQFNDWAKLERTNHQKAHPGYKFAPAKPRKKVEKEVRRGDDDDSALDDWDWNPADARRAALARRAGTPLDDAAYSPSPHRHPSPYGHHPAAAAYLPSSAGGYPPVPGVPSQHHLTSRSAFAYTNPGKRLPAPYDPADLAGSRAYYYQQLVQQGAQRGVEDIVIRKTPSPGSAFLGGGMPGGGMPGGDQLVDPLGHPYEYGSAAPTPQPQVATPPPGQQQQQRFEPRIDPSLMMGPEEAALYFAAGGAGLGLMDPATGQAWGPPPPLGVADGLPAVGGYADAFVGYDEENFLEDPTTARLLRGEEESWKVEQHYDDQLDWAGEAAPEP